MAIVLATFEVPYPSNHIMRLTADDNLIIFYEPYKHYAFVDAFLRRMEVKPKIEYKPIFAINKDSLKHTLISYLGYLIKQNEGKDVKYYIIGDYKKYIDVVTFWIHQSNAKISFIPEALCEIKDLFPKK